MATDKGVYNTLNLVYLIVTGVFSVLYVWGLYNIPILAVGVRHLRRSSRGKSFSKFGKERLPMVSIIVPVKDEERVVGRLLKALLRMDYPVEKREIVIVEDGSVDKTVEISMKDQRGLR